MNTMLKLFLAVFLSYQPAYATEQQIRINENLISCSNGSFGCSFLTGIIVDGIQPYESQFDIEATFDCEAFYELNIFTDKENKSLKRLSPKNITILGMGPLKISDAHPTRTSSYPKPESCTITINKVNISPSNGTRTSWMSEKDSLNIEIPDAKKARDGYSDLLRYRAAFEILNRVVVNILSDLSQNLELRHLLALGGDGFQAILGVASSSDPLFTEAQKRAVISLIAILAKPNVIACTTAPDQPCPPVVLGNYLSDDKIDENGSTVKGDKTLIAEVANHLLEIPQAESNYIYFTEKTLKLEQKLIELCKVSKKWIDWTQIPEGCN